MVPTSDLIKLFDDGTPVAEAVRRAKNALTQQAPPLLQLQLYETHITAEMRRGDVLLFDQFTYHRGLPNLSRNVTRWSVDFR